VTLITGLRDVYMVLDVYKPTERGIILKTHTKPGTHQKTQKSYSRPPIMTHLELFLTFVLLLS
jgi:hypothetical protein